MVDKEHFNADADFGRDMFLTWVREAVAYGEAAHHAEGQLPAQQERLATLSLCIDDGI